MTTGSSRIAVVRGADGQTIQALFATMADDYRSRGLKVSGTIAESHNLPERTCSAGVLRDIASGARYPIYYETAPAGTSCHLDGAGVEAACASLLGQIDDSDLVVLSKFGKLEAMHKGLFPAFEAAVASGKPVLTTVSAKHVLAWQEFAADAAFIEADKARLTAWAGL